MTECYFGRDTHHYYIEMRCMMCQRYMAHRMWLACRFEPGYGVPMRRVGCEICGHYLAMMFFCSHGGEETDRRYFLGPSGYHDILYEVLVRNID